MTFRMRTASSNKKNTNGGGAAALLNTSISGGKAASTVEQIKYQVLAALRSKFECAEQKKEKKYDAKKYLREHKQFKMHLGKNL
jgi:hypothetical protein